MNYRAFAKFPVTLLVMTAFLGTISAAVAADSERHQRVDGMDVYLGVMPAEVTQGHPGMHAGLKNHDIRFHVLVALFDAKAGTRIADAKVQAIVSEPGGMAAQSKDLEPMHIMDAPSYGNYFRMSDPGKYRLRFKILDPARKYAVTAKFVFDRPKD